MQQPLPPLTKHLAETFAAQAIVWLVRLLRILMAPAAARRGRLLRRFVQAGERTVEHVLFVMAGQRLGLDVGRRRLLRHPFAAPTGFRIARGDNRLLWKSARLRLRGASLSQRVGRLLAALACPEPYVAHYMKRLAHGLNFTRICAFAPPAARLGADAPQALLPADTS